LSSTVSLLAGTDPDVFAGVRWDGAASQYVFDAVDLASAQGIIDTGLLPGTSYRVEPVPRSSTQLRALRDRVWALDLDTIWGTAQRSRDGTVAISISAVDEGALTVIAETLADERDAICLVLEPAPVALVGIEPSLSGVEQTTTTYQTPTSSRSG
jgi:hypothetical protein